MKHKYTDILQCGVKIQMTSVMSSLRWKTYVMMTLFTVPQAYLLHFHTTMLCY